MTKNWAEMQKALWGTEYTVKLTERGFELLSHGTPKAVFHSRYKAINAMNQLNAGGSWAYIDGFEWAETA